MKNLNFFIGFIFALIIFEVSSEDTGRYCAYGAYDANTGAVSDYDDEHWCGLFLLDFRACVTITKPSGWTRMGCDSDWDFPTCKHDDNYCYMNGTDLICCCQSDHCNDCHLGNANCTWRDLAATTAIPTTTKPACSGMVWQGKCYTFNATPTAFMAAEFACNSIGGHLASVHDGFTNSFLSGQGVLNFPSAIDFWIGATLEMTGTDWTWTDNSKFDFYDFSKQNTGNCAAHQLADSYWNADSCIKPKPFVCQKDMSS